MKNSFETYRDICYALDSLIKAMEKEKPQTLFVWVLESKVRAYTRKLAKVSKDYPKAGPLCACGHNQVAHSMEGTNLVVSCIGDRNWCKCLKFRMTPTKIKK